MEPSIMSLTSSPSNECDEVSRLGESPLTPIKLLTSMHLRANKDYWIHPTSRIRVGDWDKIIRPSHFPYLVATDGRTLCNQLPGIILPSGAMQIRLVESCWLHAVGPMGAAFVDGWNKLAVELKVNILNIDLRKPYKIRYDDHPASLLRLLRLTPEMADLSKGFYYKTNTFELKPLQKLATTIRHDLQYKPTLRGPPPTVRNLICKVVFKCSVNIKDWELLRTFATGTTGYTGLCHVEIRVEWGSQARAQWAQPGSMENVKKALQGYVQFSCAGRIEIVCENAREPTVRVLEEILERKVLFEGSEPVPEG
ncbi:hypothetical protein CC80DRAFT_533990 [Byssothecium circinans]|uniref:Uncharacterized protein n=1 Tax=Byssothecium circinans TaxID=147558 RepID=A0A6A5U5A3_9PLEO|nr:hypothetical protein CC80DRAFT_533990 [Byssothecium circinans]